jgi:hypothetical protein
MSTLTIAGLLLIAVPFAFNAAFATLAARFDYPNVLRQSTADVLAKFRAGGTSLRTPMHDCTSSQASVSAAGSSRLLAHVGSNPPGRGRGRDSRLLIGVFGGEGAPAGRLGNASQRFGVGGDCDRRSKWIGVGDGGVLAAQCDGVDGDVQPAGVSCR